MWIVIFLRMPAVTTCAGQAEGYIFTYARCDGGASVVFLTIPIVPGYDDLCRVCGLLYFYLYASCDDPCRVYRVLCFYLCQLRRMHQILFFYLCQLCQAMTTCARVCGLLYFYLCMQAVPGKQRILFFYLCQLSWVH